MRESGGQNFIPPIEPLHWPDGREPTKTRFERVANFVPILGWFASQIVYRVRMGRVARRIDDEQLSRRPLARQTWGTDSRRLALAEFVSDLIADEFGWTSANFIPDDPVQVLFCPPGYDGAESFVIFTAIEDRMGCRIDIQPLYDHGPPTLGQLVDYCIRVHDIV